MLKTDVCVIGGGPAGLAAAIAAEKNGARTLLIEREERLGGILKQCIHDGFGLVRFGEKLSGPEYAERFMEEIESLHIACRTQSFVTSIKKEGDRFLTGVVDRNGITDLESAALVLATGCRERTAKQVFIHGDRPAGVFTAGTAQHFINLLGERVTRRCCILGSGDIGLIMARRLTLEGAQVAGVYEVKPEPSGLMRNIRQCLDDYNIPLYLSHTVTRVFGEERLTGVEVARVDSAMKPVPGTQRRIDCDALILSVGLIPENEIALSLGVKLDTATKGPVCDTRLMTNIPGVFSCGNALHVNDLADYVTESGERAGTEAARFVRTEERESGPCITFACDEGISSIVPQRIARSRLNETVTLYFRSRRTVRDAVFSVKAGERTVFEKKYAVLRPPEMQRLTLEFGRLGVGEAEKIGFDLKGGV